MVLLKWVLGVGQMYTHSIFSVKQGIIWLIEVGCFSGLSAPLVYSPLILTKQVVKPVQQAVRPLEGHT